MLTLAVSMYGSIIKGSPDGSRLEGTGPTTPSLDIHLSHPGTIMPTIAEVTAWLDRLAPPELAEEWDNVGLLVGDADSDAARVMTCLTITPASADEAIRRNADLIITHHPLPFRPVRRLTTASPEGALLLRLIAAGVAIYSAHTAFDSAMAGINQRLAEGLGLTDIRPLVPLGEAPAGLGSGRFGQKAASTTLAELVEQSKAFLQIAQVQVVGDINQPIQSVAVACGSGGEFLAAARTQGCDCLVTGEARFHTCLEAETAGLSLLLPGHFASERFAVERLAEHLAENFPALQIWPSRDEADPVTSF